MALGCAGAALVAAGCGLTASKTKTVTTTVTRTVTTTHTVSTPYGSGGCSAHDLTATFEVLQGSAGAGNIVYTLRVTNAGQKACTVQGVPLISEALDASGMPIAFKATQPTPGSPIVALQPGDSATSQIRFSPDVDPCEPGTWTTLRLQMPDDSTLDVKVSPVTRLCGAGSLQPTPFSRAS